MSNNDNYGKRWTRDETILALSFYYETPYGKINRSNKYLQSMADLMQRSLSSLIMKMVNLASLDESLLRRGVTSLPHSSKLDKDVWSEFKGKYEYLLLEKERILSSYNTSIKLTNPKVKHLPPAIDLKYYTPKERLVLVRKGQDFFRKAVLSAYGERCCMTGIAIPELLQACHIMPYNKCKNINDRLNPSNGICLNYLTHKAFDLGFISIHKDTKTIMVSNCLKKHPRIDKTTKNWLLFLENKSINYPERNMPEYTYLEYHNDCIFKS